MPVPQADFSGVLNPKRVIERRVEAAEAPSPASAPASSARFGKKWSPGEQAAQRKQLADLLRARDASK